jgi:hypothetical protein
LELPKRWRLEEAFRRMREAPADATAEEALVRFSNILNDVEDQWTSIPYEPRNWEADGRLYPPQRDSARVVPGHPRVVRYRSRMHNMFIGRNGGIEVRAIDGTVQFQKAGADGRTVWELD